MKVFLLCRPRESIFITLKFNFINYKNNEDKCNSYDHVCKTYYEKRPNIVLKCISSNKNHTDPFLSYYILDIMISHKGQAAYGIIVTDNYFLNRENNLFNWNYCKYNSIWWLKEKKNCQIELFLNYFWSFCQIGLFSSQFDKFRKNIEMLIYQTS